MTRKGPDDLSDRTVVRSPSAARNEQSPVAAGNISSQATVFEPNGAASPVAPAPAAATVFQPALPVAPGSGGARPAPASPAADGGVRYGSANAILAAAAPLLTVLGRLRLRPIGPDVADLAHQAAAAIEAFELRMTKFDAVAAQDVDAARYVLCAMADDTIASLPGYADWGRHSMLARFFPSQDQGGAGFFTILNQVLAAPEARCDLLELMHTCLSLGFQGQYRGLKADVGALQRVREDAYESLRYFRRRPSLEISPHWQASASAHPQSRRRVPLWGFAAAAATVVTVSFFGLRTAVTADGDRVASELLTLTPATPVAIARSEIVPVIEAARTEAPRAPPPPEPAPPSRLDRIRTALDQDIQAHRLTVGTRGDVVVIAIDNQILFGPGGVKPDKAFEPVASHIAAALDVEPGTIRVVGHTDSVKPGKSSAFKSNFDLSVARAKAVAAFLAPHLHDAARLTVEGKGDDEPIADNATAEGRAKNRRIDVLIARDADAAPDIAVSDR